MHQLIYGQHKLDLVFWVFFIEGAMVGGRWAWGEQEASVIGVHCTKLPNNKNIVLGEGAFV